MIYYHFSKKKISQKAKERYSKKKAAEYYSQDKEAIIKKKHFQNKWVLFLLSKRMSEKTLKFDNIRLDKKEFHKSKQPINLDLVNVDQIVVSDKFKYSDDGFKHLIGYKEGKIVKLLCIILPQMSEYMKYFKNSGKSMSFVIKDDDVLDKYNKIWNKVKKDLNIKLHGMPVYDGKYINVKVREFNRVIKTKILGDEIPKENVHYACVSSITIDSVMRMEKKIIRKFI